jgi:CHASE1-domain containing sensor protein
MLTKIIEFVNDRVPQSGTKVKMKAKSFIDRHLDDIILLIGVILISLLSFAAGFISARQQEKEPIKLEYHYEQQNSLSYSFIS